MEERSTQPLKYLLNRARNQSAKEGGGRMNCVAAGRKMVEDSATEIASAAVAKTGVDSTVWVLSPT